MELDLVVLEGDEGESKAWVAVEPELKGYVELGLGVGTSGALVELGKRAVDEGLELLPLLLRVGKLSPHVHPLTVVGVDDLTADLDLHLLDHEVAETGGVEAVHAALNGKSVSVALAVVKHIEVSGGTGTGSTSEAGGEGIGGYIEVDLKVHAVGEVTVAADSASYLAAESGLAVEGLLDGLHGEVSVTTSYKTEESDLRLTSKIDILGAVSYKLH